MLSAYAVNFHIILIITWVFCRVLHTVAFAYEMQPLRSIVWMVAVLCVLFMLGNTTPLQYGSST